MNYSLSNSGILIPRFPWILGSSETESDHECALCKNDIIYIAMFTIRAYDVSTGKEVKKEMEFPVCDDHSDKVSFEIQKKLKVPSRIIIV